MKAVIAAYARSPFHFARKGRLAEVRPDTLAAQVVQGLLKRRPGSCTIGGCDPRLCLPRGRARQQSARIVGLLAGLPETVGGMTVNRFCGSSMQAVHIAAAQIEAGMGDAFLCVGVESMTMVPQGGFNFRRTPVAGKYRRLYFNGRNGGKRGAEMGVTRADQELLALQSHLKAAAARDQGLLVDEIVPILLPDGELLDADGCIRPATTLEALAGLKPAFRPDGVVTAGTSSPLTDGAAAVLVTRDDFAERHGLQALARIRSFATVGVDPAIMGIGPIPAARKALARAGLTVADLDVVEINEAFSSQALACIRDLGLDMATVNIDGGGLAIGHPLGATGARITGKAAALLARQQGRYALATQCIGGGQGIATVLERP
jgi:acetyl-CoA acyltransferase